jgi:hypothetical protein
MSDTIPFTLALKGYAGLTDEDIELGKCFKTPCLSLSFPDIGLKA